MSRRACQLRAEFCAVLTIIWLFGFFSLAQCGIASNRRQTRPMNCQKLPRSPACPESRARCFWTKAVSWLARLYTCSAGNRSTLVRRALCGCCCPPSIQTHLWRLSLPPLKLIKALVRRGGGGGWGWLIRCNHLPVLSEAISNIFSHRMPA